MKIPKKAEAEICRKLAENLQISSDEISDILEKHGVREDDQALQRSYRKRLGQQLMASFRDEAGKREILAAPNGKGGMVYIIIDCCPKAPAHPVEAAKSGSRAGFHRRKGQEP